MELLKVVNAQLASLEHSDAAATQRDRDRIKAVVNQLADRVFNLFSLYISIKFWIHLTSFFMHFML